MPKVTPTGPTKQKNFPPKLPALALIFSICTIPLAAQSTAPPPAIPPSELPGYQTLTASEIKSDLAYIASDKLAGRMSLQPGDQLAIQWIADNFAKAGLKPIATDPTGNPTYLQSFSLIEYRPDRTHSSISLTRSGITTVLNSYEAFSQYKTPLDLTAPVVVAGYGITAPELHYDDYANLDAKAKIVLVFDHEPQEDDPHSIFNGTGNTRYATARVKLLNAQAHGALAVLLAPEPNRHHPTNQERQARIALSPGGAQTRTVPLPLQAIADDELHIPVAILQDKVTVQLLATAGQTGSQLQSAIDKDLTPQSRSLTDTQLTFHLLNSVQHQGVTSNVAGLLEGSDPALTPETILITAHHDHDGQTPCPTLQALTAVSGAAATKPTTPGMPQVSNLRPASPEGQASTGGVDQTGQPIPPGPDCLQTWHGADDNGSGTIGVVELAKAFAANPTRPKRSILFVVFASEERGLLGSYYMAQHPLRPLATTRAQINFDMIGRDETPSPQTDGLIQIPADTTNRLNLIGALYSPTYNSVVMEENKLVGLTLDDRFDHESALNVFFRSDQFPFVLKNIPALWWFTGFHPDYHHITDTAEKIDYPKMTKILDLAYLTAWRFSTDQQTPKFIPNPQPN